MWGTEPDGTGRHGVRVAGVEAREWSFWRSYRAREGWCYQAAGASGGQSDVPVTARGEPGARLVGTARDLGEIRLQRVQRLEQRRLFRELVGRYHYLGHRVPCAICRSRRPLSSVPGENSRCRWVQNAVIRQLAVDWPRSYGVEAGGDAGGSGALPGDCYRGANWIELGSTRGGKREDRLERRARR